MLVNSSYFDKDLDNYVFKVPAKYDRTEFQIYMDTSNNATKPKTFTSSSSTGAVEEKDEFEILREVLMLIPEEKIGAPLIDGDEIIINPVIYGDMSEGGIVNSKK